MNNFNKIAEALHYIDNNLKEDLDFKHIADRFHFSPFYFHRVFSAIVGKTITAHIRSRRLEKACKLLADTDKSITSICIECGFDSSQAFCRTFKNNYGVSPKEFRSLGYVPAELSVEEMIIKFTKTPLWFTNASASRFSWKRTGLSYAGLPLRMQSKYWHYRLTGRSPI
jgi:AraC-like DNA-binding protein